MPCQVFSDKFFLQDFFLKYSDSLIEKKCSGIPQERHFCEYFSCLLREVMKTTPARTSKEFPQSRSQFLSQKVFMASPLINAHYSFKGNSLDFLIHVCKIFPENVSWKSFREVRTRFLNKAAAWFLRKLYETLENFPENGKLSWGGPEKASRDKTNEKCVKAR